MFERITVTPGIMGGRACIRGMRITVSHLANMAVNGMSIEEILLEYPDLEPDDVQEAFQYAVQNDSKMPLLECIKILRATVPRLEWKTLPADGAMNLDHYLNRGIKNAK